jgi:hypothetical protein
MVANRRLRSRSFTREKWRNLMTRVPNLFLATTVFLSCSNLVALSQPHVRSNSTQSINELPFCAFILRSLDSRRGHEVYVLTEQDQITEGNLILLFKAVSDRNPNPSLLEVFVNTDVDQLRSLVVHMNTSGDFREKPEKRYQWAYYKRSEKVELFRYNPNYPEDGLKTVIIRGTE